MPQSFHQLYAHIIFSTKNREPYLQGDIRTRMHAYLAALCRDCGAPWVVVGGVADHVHIALDLGKTMGSVDIVAAMKKKSSAWVKDQGDPGLNHFFWQKGYGLFSFGYLQRDAVEAYVRNQQEHHAKISFQDEFRSFLKRYNIPYDERYIWD